MSGAMVRVLVLVLVLLLVLVVLFFVLRPTPVAEGPRERAFDLAIEGGVMTPDEVAVEEGDQVELRVTSDSPLEFHLHGFDLTEEIEPGEPAELSFDTTTTTGRFEIENEETGEELGLLLVQPRASEEG